MKFFAVELSTVAIVQADTEMEALKVARSDQCEILSDSIDLDHKVIGEIKTPKDIAHHGWDEGCLPYGGDGKTRLGELLREMAEHPAPAERCTRTLELPLDGAA